MKAKEKTRRERQETRMNTKKKHSKKILRGDIGADQTNKSRKFYTQMHRQKMKEKGPKKITARE